MSTFFSFTIFLTYHYHSIVIRGSSCPSFHSSTAVGAVADPTLWMFTWILLPVVCSHNSGEGDALLSCLWALLWMNAGTPELELCFCSHQKWIRMLSWTQIHPHSVYSGFLLIRHVASVSSFWVLCIHLRSTTANFVFGWRLPEFWFLWLFS